jgi:hypothetical protein
VQNWEGLRYRKNSDDTVSFFNEKGRCVMMMSNESFLLHEAAAQGVVPNPRVARAFKTAAQLVALAATCSCAREPPVDIDITDQPDWIVDALEGASEFWALHDIEVNLVEDPEAIQVRAVTREEIPGNNAQWFPIYNTIKMSERHETTDPLNALCGFAHEIGHVIGMGHVDADGSLMGVPGSRRRDGCYWSAEDQIELCRVTGCNESKDEK